ncbi:hypothetical protein KY342_03310 [Candidatus Woesearchaeota archaeon]|nr:hypothetical protein [Candidatus Woesearchaeota archaeon]
MTLDDLVSLEDGARFYVEHLRENRDESRSIVIFYQRFDVEEQKLLPFGKTGQLNKYYHQFLRLKRNGKSSKNLIFENWIKQQIPSNLKEQLEQLTEKYLREYTLEQGVRFYLEYLRENKEKRKPITVFYQVFDTENKELLSQRKIGQLCRYYQRFYRLKKIKKLSKDLTFEDWIKQQIPFKLKKQLEQLTEKYLKKYTLEQGVEFYIEYIKEKEEKSSSIGSFCRKFNLEKQKLLPRGKIGRLNRYYCRFLKQKKTKQIAKDLTFEDWIKSQISPKLKKQLESLTEKYLKEYTLEQGVEFYIKYLRQNKEKSLQVITFYKRFDLKKKELLPKRKTGQLHKHYGSFLSRKKRGKLPKNLTFENWIKQQIPLKLEKQLEHLTEKYLKEYTLEQGVEFYVEHLNKNKEKSLSIVAFYMRFDTEKQELFSFGKTGQLNRYYARFAQSKRKNKLPKSVKTFEDWIKQQIPSNLKEQLEQLTEKYLKEYTLEQGVEFYIKHLKREKEKSSPISAFYKRFDPKKQELLPIKNQGKLIRYYARFVQSKIKNKLPKDLSFADYLLQNLPEEKRERAEYYLKGQYLADLIDRRKLKEILLR